ncbi:hypothetical protein LJC36_00935 [Desulfovibrio sp. OttesenSCG-928-C14]|nr:hypothetical protein [Desulfovibrio sp. OttesenSCG-928-C14]
MRRIFAGCSKLRKVEYYAVKGADFSTLGKLTQVQELVGGLTDLNDISWIAELPNLKKFSMFAEGVTDYTPLAKAKVEDLQIWKMKNPVDLTQLSGATSLTKLKLWILTDATGFEGLGSLVNLKELIFDGVNEKNGSVDLAFAKSLANLETLTLKRGVFLNSDSFGSLTKLKKLSCSDANIRGDIPFDLTFLAKTISLENLDISNSTVRNFDAVAGSEKLKQATLVKTSGVTSLGSLKKLPSLKGVVLSKGAFPDTEISGFGEKVKITQR